MQFTTPTDRLHLIHSAKAGNAAAMEALLREHEDLIESVAARFAGAGCTHWQNREDFRQDARLAFMKAVHGFRLDSPVRLEGYARRVIENECRDQWPTYHYPLTIPRVANDRRVVCYRAERRLQARLHREPMLAEIAAEVGLSSEVVAQVMHLPPLQPLDRPIRPSLSAAEDRYDSEIPVTDDHAVGILLWRALLQPCVATLPALERQVITRTFGLGGGPPEEQQQIARDLGLGPMAVSRLKQRALRSLRAMIGEAPL
jgi:RNA polymerase sigma factor (sigma-70 family)